MEKMPPLVFHPDWFDIIEDLPQEQQLGIYRAIMLYAFKGEKPTDPIQRAVTSLMRKFIDKDREKYARAIQQRKEAIRKRWEKKQQQDKPNQTDTTEYDRKEPNQTEYEPLRADTITNTTTTTITTIHDHNHNQDHLQRDKSLRSRPLLNAHEGDGFDHSSLIARFFAPERQASLEAMAMNLHVSLQDLRALGEETVNDWILTEETHRDYNDAARHLQTIIRAKVADRRKRTPQDAPTEDGLGVGEFRDSQGRRTYDKGGVIIPETARPRPSVSHWWNEAMNDWCDTM